MAIDPFQAAVTECFTAIQQPAELGPSLAGQPAADMTAPFIAWRVTPGQRRQLDDAFRNLFLALVCSAGKIFDRPTATVTGGEIHPGINPGRIMAQQLFHPAELLEDFPPVQQGQHSQAGKSIAAGQLFAGLAILFAQGQVVQRGLESTLQPALDRRQCSRLVIEQADQLRDEIGAGRRLRLGKLGQK